MTLRTEFMAAAFVVAALGISAAPANAVTFSVIGKDAATSTAEIDFTYDGISQLTLGITNTESASADPRITSFAFNLPSVITGASFASVSGTQDDSKWVLQLNNDGINTPGNLGQFDIDRKSTRLNS